MVADLRKMQENQGVSENRIDKSPFGRGISDGYAICQRKRIRVRYTV